LLIYWVGADDSATQSDSEFNNDSASDESSDSDKASRLSFESVRPRRPTVEKSERVTEEDIPDPPPDAAPEALDSEFVESGWGSSKKSKKKSKISARRAIFEEE
jgi:hypothetical protein